MPISVYPQPNSNIPALAGQDYFRLKQPLLSPGDIYTSEQGSHAVAIGPDSDIALVTVISYDENSDSNTKVISTNISPSRALVGTAYARNDANYIPSGIRGRVMFYPANNYQPFFKPGGYSNTKDKRIFIRPVLDVIQYFTQADSIAPERNDKVFTIEDYEWHATTDDGTTYLTIPYYGRSYANVNIKNLSGAALTFGIVGVNFVMGGNPSGAGGIPGVETILHAAAALADGSPLNLSYNARTDGAFDALTFSIQTVTAGVINVPLHIVTSDVPK